MFLQKFKTDKDEITKVSFTISSFTLKLIFDPLECKVYLELGKINFAIIDLIFMKLNDYSKRVPS